MHSKISKSFKLSKNFQYASRFFFCIVIFVLFTTYNLPWSIQHMAIISTTYFSLSSSYLPNTMVILFNAQKGFWPPWPLMCFSKNETQIEQHSIATLQYAFLPISICKWSVYLATCQVTSNPIEFVLRDVHLNSNAIKIPFRKTFFERKLNVVSCFSPLFFNERWQLIVSTLELYRQMGISLQVYYVQSMLFEIVQFLQVYEKQNITRIKTWNKIDIGFNNNNLDFPKFDPNTELEWRNQAAAHTDCLLKYKEAAEFIIISDIDDVLIPQLGSTYLDEFKYLTAMFPSATGFSYNRYNTELISSKNPDDFTLTSLLNSARIANEWEDPKYVVHPSKVQSVWLHWPGIINSGKMKTISNDLNFMIHFRNWSMIDFVSTRMPRIQKRFKLFQYQMSRFLQPNQAKKIEKNFRKFLSEHPLAAELFDSFPHDIKYYPLIVDCYNKIFYGRGKKPVNCPGPIRCHLPPIEGLKCALSQRIAKHQTLNNYVTVHFFDNSGEFVISDSGCRM